MINIFRNQKKILYGQSRKITKIYPSFIGKLWSDTSEFDPSWKQRIAFMANYISIPGKVADFGCGMMWLEEYLKPENSYLPIDYIARDERTIVIDLNGDLFPEIEADIAFMSGILEYICKPNTLVKILSKQNFKQIITSYCSFEKFSDLNQRKSLNWKSHLSIFDLIEYFTSNGYALHEIDDYKKNTILIFFKK